MAALLVLLLLLAVPPTAFTTTDVYYVTAHDAAGHEQSCPPHQQICHRNLSYYISHSDSYFTSDTTIIFLEGEHSFDREDLVHVINVHNLTLKGQGQWPVAGAEETVMQSVVIINCTRGRGGFYFGTSHDITVEGLTVVNCGGLDSAVFSFSTVQSLFFHKNSIQLMTGYGLHVHNCNNVIITNCSYYHSSVFNISNSSQLLYGGGVGIVYDTQYSNTGYTLELSHSNMTKCCNYDRGGLYLQTLSEFGQAKVFFNHLKLFHNRASSSGGGIAVGLQGNGNVTLVVSNCVLFNGSATYGGGINMDVAIQSAAITIENTDFVDNHGEETGEMKIQIQTDKYASRADVSLLNSTVYHTKTYSGYGVRIEGCCANVQLTNTSMRFANVHFIGILLFSTNSFVKTMMQMDSCQFIGSTGVSFIVYLYQVMATIRNSIFSNNTSGSSVIILRQNGYKDYNFIHSCTISDNNMTGITLIEANEKFSGHNVIQNNRNTEGAGITLYFKAYIVVYDELLLYNNTADKHGGAILVKQQYFLH